MNEVITKGKRQSGLKTAARSFGRVGPLEGREKRRMVRTIRVGGVWSPLKQRVPIRLN